MKKGKGFTLIELLVVISLMGLLCGIVLASLDRAREMGMAGAVEAKFASLRAQAERYYTENNTYGDTDTSDKKYGVCYDSSSNLGFGYNETTGLLQELADIVGVPKDKIYPGNEQFGKYNWVTCHSAPNGVDPDVPTAWVVEAPMIGSKDEVNPLMYCMDSSMNILISNKSVNIGAHQYSCIK